MSKLKNDYTVYKPKSKEMHAWKTGEERGLWHVSG